MDDITKPFKDMKQQLGDQTNAASDGLNNAADMVSQFADTGLAKVEEKLDEYTGKADSMLDSFENFLNKF